MHQPARLFRTLLVAATLAPSALFAAGSGGHSGYLKDYSQLKSVKDGNGEGLQRWSSPKLSPDTYHAVIVDPVVLYPKPDGSEKVSAETLTAIAAYMTDAIKQQVGAQVQVVDAPGPGVARIAAALTSVETGKRGLKAYQFIPVALVATTIKRAAKGAPVDAKLFVETEITDSVSGEPLLRSVREGAVEDLKANQSGDKALTLDVLKPLIDRWAAEAARASTNLVAPKS